jgi:hypothetical protein
LRFYSSQSLTPPPPINESWRHENIFHGAILPGGLRHENLRVLRHENIFHGDILSEVLRHENIFHGEILLTQQQNPHPSLKNNK